MRVGARAGSVGAALWGAVFCIVPAGYGAEPVAFEYVPAEPSEPGGPAYGFFISKFEIRNDQYVEFLNSAVRSLADPRGQFLCFDIHGAGVFVHSGAVGEVGELCGGTPLFLVSGNPHVAWHAGTLRYYVQPGFEAHPVTGVSWYGAIKYCNWLTLNDGIDAGERAYGEGTADQLSSWRPVTIGEDEWALRDLNEGERAALLQKRGYRLPMDGGAVGANPGPYNEWYKAAAWDGAAGGHRTYGFGRDVLSGADANYRCSGDPFEDPSDCERAGTTPVGFFDGTVYHGGLATHAETNPYSLFDLSGNVWEWMQDRGADVATRRNRGGSFRSPAGALQVDTGADRAAQAIHDATGFRVVLVPEISGQIVALPAADLVGRGPWGGPLSVGSLTYSVINVSDASAELNVNVDAPWLAANILDASTLAPGEQTRVEVSVDARCEDGLVMGDNFAEVRIGTEPGEGGLRRKVRLWIEEPLSMEMTESGELSVVYGETRAAVLARLDIANRSESTVRWTLETIDRSDPSQFAGPAGWLTFHGLRTITVETPGGSVAQVDVELDSDAIGILPPGEYSADVLLTDECTGEVVVEQVRVQVLAPFEVGEANPSPLVSLCGTPAAGGGATRVTITNPTSEPVSWTVESDWPELLEVRPASGTTPPLGTAVVEIALMPGGGDLPPGSYPVTIDVTHRGTDFRIGRTLVVEARSLPVSPEGAILFHGPVGGPFEADADSLTLLNPVAGESGWSTRFVDTSKVPVGDWLEAVPSAGTMLGADQTTTVLLRASSSAAEFPAGTYTGFMEVLSDVSQECRASRPAKLIVSAPPPSVEMVVVPAEDHQPGGPEHTFRLMRYEVTNRQFVDFLNDTLLYPETERAAFIHHGSPRAGAAALIGDGTLLFDGASGGAITVDGGHYTVDAESEDLPVVGVSWFGAAKYCNWLTLMQGMREPDQRVYHEGPTAGDWFSLFSPAELASGERPGFRLPMDGGSAGPSLYSEWHKAASRGGFAANGAPVFNMVYGFGRNVLTAVDANYSGNNDTVADALTPVGYFDGNRVLASGLRSRDTSNGYGLYDLTGNVSEWLHDQGAAQQSRAVRGGHFRSLAESPSLRIETREALAPETASDQIGFRVAQTIAPGELTAELAAQRIRGYIGGALDTSALVITIQHRGIHAHDAITLSTSVPWLVAELGPHEVLEPASQTEIVLRVDAGPGVAEVLPAPGTDFVWISGDDRQVPDGPTHGYWMQRTEVTNQAFAEFLNDTLSNVGLPLQQRDARSAYMFFDEVSGDVYISDAETGEAGRAPVGGRYVAKLYEASSGRIARTASGYVVDPAFASHPVAGVSWFGATKYCNWLNFRQGIPRGLWPLRETGSLAGEGWGIPSGVDVEQWMAATVGYRLPMDQGSASAAPFNEWYKAAAWNPTEAEPSRNVLYAFGRETLDIEDAQYDRGSDLWPAGTSPVGHYDGLQDVRPTETECYPRLSVRKSRKTENRYGLQDLCGNVAEWVADAGETAAERGTRGGGWRDGGDSPLLTNTGRVSRNGGDCRDDVGFRVVRDAGQVGEVTLHDGITGKDHRLHVVVEFEEPLLLEPAVGRSLSVSLGEAGLLPGWSYTMTNRSAAAMDWSAESDVPWLEVRGARGENGGVIDGGASTVLTARVTGQVENLGAGSHSGHVLLRNVSTGAEQKRPIEVIVLPPVQLVGESVREAAFEGIAGGPFHVVDGGTEIQFINGLSRPVRYSVRTSEGWISTVSPDPLSGTMPAFDEHTVELQIGGEAAALSVGEHRGAVVIDYLDPLTQLGGLLRVAVVLRVLEPLSVTPLSPWTVQGPLDPRVLPAREYELTLLGNSATEVLADSDVGWLAVDPPFAQVSPGSTVPLNVRLTAVARELAEGTHEGTILLTNLHTGVVQCRAVQLSVGNSFRVGPVDRWRPRFLQPQSATSGELSRMYHLWRPGADGLATTWTARVAPPVPWLKVNGGESSGGTLAPGESVAVVVSIDAEAASALVPGIYEAELEFADLTGDTMVIREVSLHVAAPAFRVDEKPVSMTAVQPGGPQYTFWVHRREVTNAEFAAFLNSMLNSQENERGAFCFVNLANGDVYMNDRRLGEAGLDTSGRSVKLFSPSVASRIQFNGSTYSVAAAPVDYSDHPVTGVSWYGSVKYCNWLTLDQGFNLSDRCYFEDVAANAAGWRPVVVSLDVWQSRDLDAVERGRLIGTCAGYRLPMDQGADNPVPTTDSADSYNEWLKAAAWQPEMQPPRNTMYAFGRDLLTAADANFRDSGDGFDNGTTPAGLFAATDANAFGLLDLTGNVYEWMQDRFNLHADSIAFRTIRGGGWKDSASSAMLRAATRTFTSPGRTDEQIGFRVVRASPPPVGDVDGDGDIDSFDGAYMSFSLTGPAPAASPDIRTQDLDGDGDVDLADFGVFQRLFIPRD